jgi:hypothetical protein
MTEKQYEDLMFALSTIIGLLKSEILTPYPGVDHKTAIRMDRARLERWAEEAYKDITGNTPSREVMHEILRREDEEGKAELQEMLNEVREKEEAQEKNKKEEEEAEQAKQAELERIKNEELEKREAFRVTDTDYLNEGDTNE